MRDSVFSLACDGTTEYVCCLQRMVQASMHISVVGQHWAPEEALDAGGDPVPVPPLYHIPSVSVQAPTSVSMASTTSLHSVQDSLVIQGTFHGLFTLYYRTVHLLFLFTIDST